METLRYSVDSRERHNLRTGTRIYNTLYGLLLIAIGFLIIKKNSASFLSISTVILGFFSLAYGLIGKELLVTHDTLIMDSGIIKIKRSFRRTVRIKLSSVTYIKMVPATLEITFKDYVKPYDLSWMTTEEFLTLKTKLQFYCSQNKIGIE